MTTNKTFSIMTKRLKLKGLTTADAEMLFCYRSLPEVTRFQGWAPVAVEEAVSFIEDEICHCIDEPDTWFQMGIFLGDEEVLVGDLGIHFLADRQNTVEIGVTLSPVHQGRGLATEAVNAVTAFLFDTLNKNMVIASIDPENHRSIALVKRVGFQLEGIHNNSVLFRGEWVDDAVFVMTREQWINRLDPKL